MPCTLCGINGHNRRRCTRWDLLEAVRREEEEARSGSIQSVDNTVSHIFQTIATIARDMSSTYVVNPTEIPSSEFIDSSLDYDDLFGDLDFLDNFDELLGDLKPVALSAQLVECVKAPCVSTECPICMDEFHSTDLFVTRCGHQFHGTCMIRHMKQHDNCPMCRGVLFTPSNI